MKNVYYGSLWIIGLILLSATAMASDWGYVNESIILWSDITSGANYYDAYNATITIITPEDQTTIISAENMSKDGTGRYYYSFIPNQIGNYYALTQFYNTTAKVGQASQTFASIEEKSVQEADMVIVAAMILMLLLVFGYLYTAQIIEKEYFQGARIVLIFASLINTTFGIFMIYSVMATDTIATQLIILTAVCNIFVVLFLAFWYWEGLIEIFINEFTKMKERKEEK